MKEIIIYAIAAIASLAILAYSIHMFVGSGKPRIGKMADNRRHSHRGNGDRANGSRRHAQPQTEPYQRRQRAIAVRE